MRKRNKATIYKENALKEYQDIIAKIDDGAVKIKPNESI